MRLILSWIVYGILDASFYLSPNDLSKDTLCALAAANVGAVLIPLWAMCTLDNVSDCERYGQPMNLKLNCRLHGPEEQANDCLEWQTYSLRITQ
jgi:hypothetical protein